MVLYKIIKKRKLKDKSIRILILGLDSAGKTSIIKAIKGENIDDCSPTLGFQIHTLKYEDYVVHYWDVGGQKNLRCFWKNYFEETDGIIWVVDSSDEDRLKLCKEELDNLLNEEVLGFLTQKLIGATLLVMANKQDLRGCLNKEQIMEALDLKSRSKHQFKVFESSAVTKLNLSPAINWLIDDISSKVFTYYR